MATVVKRTPSSSRLRNSSSSTSTTTATTPRRATRASEAAAAATDEAMAVTIETAPNMQDRRILTPPPMSARSELALRLGEVSMNSPVSERRGSVASVSASSSVSASAAASHNSAAGAANNATSLIAQNRAMLLSGLPKGDSSRSSSPVSQPPQRRDSGNGSLSANRRLTPLVTVTGAATQQRRHPLSAHPHSAHPHHLGGVSSPMAQSPRTISPCVYVKAVGLRRPSAASVIFKKDSDAGSNDMDAKTQKAEKAEKTEKTEKTVSKTSSASSTKSNDSLLSTPPPESRLVVSARITPANAEKLPFTLQREFDLQELVDALPRPDHRRPSSVNILASPIQPSPHAMPFSPSLSASSSSTGSGPAHHAAGKKRPAPDSTPASPHPSLRRHTRQSSQQKQLTPVKELPSPSQFVANGRIPIPIRPHPSLGRLPGLAAIILSRRVEAGDTIEIPVPFPEAWPMTVSYVYNTTGDAEATSEIQANLEHLGGHVNEV